MAISSATNPKEERRLELDDIAILAIAGIAIGGVASFLRVGVGIGLYDPSVVRDVVVGLIDRIDEASAILFIFSLVASKQWKNHPIFEQIEAMSGGILAGFVVSNFFMYSLIEVIWKCILLPPYGC